MDSKWTTKEVVKVVGWALAVGGMWASLTFQVHGLTTYVVALDKRLSHVEQFMTSNSKGKFMRQDDPPLADPPKP